MTSRIERVMTSERAWGGGYYELELHYPAGTPLREPLAALWSFPDLEGPVASSEVEVADQDRVDPLALVDGPYGVDGLYGTLRLPGGTRCACRSEGLRYSHGEEFVGLSVPIGSLVELSQAFEVVCDPPPYVDGVLLAVAEHVFTRVPFSRGLLGFELDADEPLRLPGSVPERRSVGVLDVQEGTLRWYPPTFPVE